MSRRDREVNIIEFMKLFYFANSRIPTEKAHGIQIMNMCEAFALQMRGMTRNTTRTNAEENYVELVLPIRKNPYLKNIDPFEYYGVEKIFSLKKIFCPDPNFLMHLPDGIYIKVQSFLFIISLYFYCRGIMQMKTRLSAGEAGNDADIFYTRDEYLLPILQKFSNRVIWEAHTLPKNTKHYLKYWQRCHKIIAITQGIKNEFIKLGLDGDKILVAPDGVKFSSSFSVIPAKAGIPALREKLNLPLDKKIVMYTGHLYFWKGVDTLLELAKTYSQKLNHQSPTTNHQLLFVFLGGTEFDIKNFKQKANGLNNVLILGHKPPKEIPKYLQAADVLVLPNSKNDEKANWTSPLKMFEYMASGVPIVASDLPVIREILNENNAVFVEPDNTKSLMQGIKKVLTNKELADKLKTQAYQDVQNYTWQKRAEKILKFIK